MQSRAKCKQVPARTNNVYHHPSNGIGATHLTPTPSNHQLAHVINSLSSPESAYSTGYSTDGTSPIGMDKKKISLTHRKILCNSSSLPIDQGAKKNEKKRV